MESELEQVQKSKGLRKKHTIFKINQFFHLFCDFDQLYYCVAELHELFEAIAVGFWPLNEELKTSMCSYFDPTLKNFTQQFDTFCCILQIKYI